ncbi:hypothetical protein BX600DRAFT_288956 [Xylariales sp. PMI_506]|nr:hypothetical protein BX600DRAFT_288956 [Xylariales sp. PMI_506]
MSSKHQGGLMILSCLLCIWERMQVDGDIPSTKAKERGKESRMREAEGVRGSLHHLLPTSKSVDTFNDCALRKDDCEKCYSKIAGLPRSSGCCSWQKCPSHRRKAAEAR